MVRNISKRIDHQFSAQIFTKKQCTSDIWCFDILFSNIVKPYRISIGYWKSTGILITKCHIFDDIVWRLCSLMCCCADPGSHYHYLSMSSLITLLVSAKSYLLQGESLSKYPFYLHLSSSKSRVGAQHWFVK